MADSPQENVATAAALSWRKVTDLHRTMGARVIRSQPPFIMQANVPVPLFNQGFGPHSIDRIIGFSLRFGGVAGPATLVLADLITSFTFPIQAGGHFGNYTGNLETALDLANVTLVCSVNVPASANASWSLYNFEVPPSQCGHYG